jgi:hypothetical protein
MIVVTGGGEGADSKDMGTLLGLIKETTPITHQLDDSKLQALIRQELTNVKAGQSVSSNSDSNNSSRISSSKRPSPEETQRDQRSAE